MKYLSPGEQKILLLLQRHRAEYWRRLSRVRTIAKIAKHHFLLAACAVGFLFASTAAANTPENAASTLAERRYSTPATAAAANTPENGLSAPNLYNKANADQRAGLLGPAILGYERAALLAPRDEAIAHNLATARKKAGVPAPVMAAWKRPAHLLTFDALAGLGSISLLLVGLLVFGTRLIPTTFRAAARGLLTTFGVTAMLAASALAVRWPELNRAVILGNHAVAHIAPAEAAESVFVLNAGATVGVRGEHGAFALVKTPDNRSGWVSKASLERIIPPASNLSSM